MTAETAPGAAETGMLAGVDAYLAKPSPTDAARTGQAVSARGLAVARWGIVAPIRWHRDLTMGSMRRRWDGRAHWLPFGSGGVERGRPVLGAVLPDRLNSVWSIPVAWIGPIRSGSSTSS